MFEIRVDRVVDPSQTADRLAVRLVRSVREVCRTVFAYRQDLFEFMEFLGQSFYKADNVFTRGGGRVYAHFDQTGADVGGARQFAQLGFACAPPYKATEFQSVFQ